MAYTQIQDVRQYDSELGMAVGLTSYRELTTAQRYPTWADSLADGISSEWVQTLANGGTITSTGGEGLLQTSANAAGSAQIIGPVISYQPGQISWLNSAVRVGDTGSAGNIRRWGLASSIVAGVPQDAFYFELNGTTLNAVYSKAGTATTVASTSWSKVSSAPFTLDTNYHGWEIRTTTNTAYFFIDGILRHSVSGTSSPLTATLNFGLFAQTINSSGATNRLLGIRNIGQGRFGEPTGLYSSSLYAPLNSTSTALEASRIIKTSSGNLFSITINNTKSSAQWVHIYDSATLPANGVVPTLSYYITATSTLVVDYKPRFFSSGIVVANSSTQATKTIGSADCLFDIQYI